MTAELSMRDLNRIHAELMKVRAPEGKCPECGKKTYSFLPSDCPGPCIECRGLTFAEWESEGVKYAGVVDREGVPVFFGGTEEMRRIMQADDRQKAAGAGLPILRRLQPDPEAPRYDWNPETEEFEHR